MDYIIYFVITIGILVFVHEFGHFAAAKMSKMRVDVFAIGFGKRLFGYNKLSGFTFGELPKDFDGQGNTDYRLSLLPLGGYVKIAGMVDESFDTDFAKSEPKPYEFRSKSTLAKLFVITAGVMMNLTLTLAIFWGINFFQGKKVMATTEVGIVDQGSVAFESGFQTGDEIVSINETKVNNWDDFITNLLVNNFGKTVDVTVNRNGTDTVFSVDTKPIAEAFQENMILLPANMVSYISAVMENSPAQEAGIQPGDVFLYLNNEKMLNTQHIINTISKNPEVDMPLTILRENDTIITKVKPDDIGKIGIALNDVYTGKVDFLDYGFFESIEYGVKDVANYTLITFSMMKNVVFGNVEFESAFGGPVKIAKFAAQSAEGGMVPFLRFLAMLSLSLAIINILPFPVLDGGHVVIIIIEGVIRKELPIKMKMAIQNAGFILLLILMAFIIYSDIMSL